MADSSIKGVFVATAVQELTELLSAKRLRPDQVEARLSAEEQALLEDKILISSWYPFENYFHLLELLADAYPDVDRRDWFRRRGEQSAERLMQASQYQQMRLVERWKISSLDAERRNLTLIFSIWSNFFNFGTWTVEADPESPDRLRVEVTNASAFPDLYVESVAGFLNAVSHAVAKRVLDPDRGREALWTWTRPSRDRVRFRMSRKAAPSPTSS